MNIYLYLKHFPSYGDDLNEGTRKAVHGFASGLAACGTDVTVLCEAAERSSFQAEAGYQIECFSNRQERPSFALSTELKHYIRDFITTIDLVILNGIFHPSVYAMSRALKRYRIPYIAAPHDPYHPTIFQKNAHLKLPYWHLLEKHVLKQATAIQALDNRHATYLRDRQISTPVIGIPNGYSPEDVHDESLLHWTPQGTAHLCFLGRLDAHNKGLDLLLDAFAEITDSYDVKLTLQGPDCGDRAALEKQVAQLKLTEKVQILKPNYARSPASIIADHDIFCLPSRFEGFSLAALEAMLAGRVILISEIAGLTPYIEASGCGTVVSPEIASIQKGLIDLLQRRSEWKEMGLRGRHYALKHLHWHEIAASALKQYEQLIPRAM
jgi:glycosyltransferase involved in cell wall biosynthesis